MICIGDKEIEYNPEFRFYIRTKLSNPHYTPEISTKTTIVNFAVKEQGLRIFEQEGYDGNQVIRTTASVGREGYGSRHDFTGTGTHLGGVKTTAW
ncbi:hypothetical protein DPMN_184996 [Dreissena polymorpha]|uniref:Dynein heavy chain ATP-binding dynein motor region domain-containing protein n=1 Tax=Dreissena polymorpha TaxID=45954 RepID=A0A9D4I7X3_DREPO|nr:hypothetical protein DPMN_184996 [Dreissena polymorpha]